MITMNELMRLAKDKSRAYTAQEWHDLQMSCPDWVAQQAVRESTRQAAVEFFRVEEEPMIDDLTKVGLNVGSVWDLVNSNKVYPTAIPILLDHLHRPYHKRIRNGIIRALTVKEAKGLIGDDILDQLTGETDEENRWALANALTVVADKKNVAAIEALLEDPHFADVGERLKKSLKQLSNGR
jgi:hypothetical protein